MFGYVRPHKTFLLVGEYEEYKAIYCALCKNLGKHYNVFTRLALNYDLTFYTVLALDINRVCPQVKKGRCVVNPMKKCNYMSETSDIYHKASALTVLMTYHKILDNLKDDSFLKSLSSRLLLPFVKGSAKKAKKQFPEFSDILNEMMTEQNAVEHFKNASIDACCEPTAKALGKIFASISKEHELVLNELGYFLGRWIYAMDAADDLKDDLKNNSFNPLRQYFNLTGNSIPEEIQKTIDEGCNEILNSNVARINCALNLLDLGRHHGIIDNILNKGLPQTQKEILFLHIREKERKNV